MEKIFNRWIDLKEDIQNIAAIVQNPGIKISDESRRFWLEQVCNLSNKIEVLKRETLTAIK